jgi:methyl-accepting chemotaxis protein
MGFSSVIFLAILIGGIGFYSLKTINTSMESMYSNNLLPIRYLGEIRNELLTIRGDVFRYIGTSNYSEYEGLENNIINSFKAIQEPLSNFKKSELTEEEGKITSEFEGHISNYEKEITSAISEHKAGHINSALIIIDNAGINRNRAIIMLNNLVNIFTETAEKDELLSKETYEKSSILMLALLLACIIISIIVTTLVTRSIKKPIAKTLKLASSMAEGDLTSRIDYHKNDELGELIQSLNDTAASLQNVIREVLSSSGAVASASQQLSANMEETNASMQEISNGISHIAETNEDNTAAIEEISATINDISNKALTTAESSKLAVETGKEVRSSALQGGELVQNVSNSIDIVRIASDEVSNIMLELEKSAHEINQAVELITGISEQTNLLSLNAAIEAARAGEQGRGFAVVADEVRALAEQSKEATKRIEQMVKVIQVNCAQAREKTINSDKLIKDSYAAANNTNSYIANIIEKINNIVIQINEISDTAIQQSLMTKEISDFIDSMAKNIESQASSSQQISATTQQQAGTIEEVGATAEELAGMAANLNSIVSKFKA